MTYDLRWKLIIAGVVGGACAVFTAGLVLGILVCRKTMKERKLAKERLARQLPTTSSLRGGHRRTSSPMLGSDLDTEAVKCAYSQPETHALLEYPDIAIRPGSFRAIPSESGRMETFPPNDTSAFLQEEIPQKYSGYIGVNQYSEQSTTSGGSSEFSESILHSDLARCRNPLYFPPKFDDHRTNTNILLHSEFSLHSGDPHRKASGIMLNRHPTQYMPPESQTQRHSGWTVHPPKFTIPHDNWSNSIGVVSSEADRSKHIYHQHKVEPDDSGRGSWSDVVGVAHGTFQSQESQPGLVELNQRRDWARARVRDDHTDSERGDSGKYDVGGNHSTDWLPTSVEEVWLPRVDLEPPGHRDNFRYTPRRIKMVR